MGQNGHKSRHDIWVDGWRVLAVSLVAFCCFLLGRGVITKPAECTQQVSAQLPNEIRFSWLRVPPEIRDRRLYPITHQGFERSAIFRRDDPVQTCEGIEQ